MRTLIEKILRKMKPPVPGLLLLLALSIAAEIFVFNFRYFLPVLGHAQDRVYTAAELSEKYGCSKQGKSLRVFNQYAGFALRNVGTPVYNIRFTLAGCTGTFDTAISYEDQNFSASSLSAGTWTVDPNVPGTQVFSVVTSGKCKNITVTLSDIADTNFSITSVEINSPYFEFSLFRVLVLFLLLAVCYLIHVYKPWRIRWNFYSGIQTVLYSLVVFACLGLTVFTYCVSADDIDFNREIALTNDNYQLLTDAFAHEQVSLALQPSARLKELSNPYDYSLRVQKNVIYSFDTAYYRGKYYSYFGVAPVLTLMLPFRLITGYYLPTSIACLVFYLIAFLALLSVYRQAVELWFPEVNLLSFLAGEAGVLLCGNLLWLISVPAFYELAFLSASAFLFLGFSLLLRAFRHPGRAVPSLVPAGLCFGLMAASRPNTVFYLLAAAPFLLLPPKGRPKRGTAARLAAFGGPLALCAAGLMAYNYVRFGSVFQFGSKYQLTLSNISWNKLTNVSLLFTGIFHYLFHPLAVTMEFPFFSVQRIVTAQTPSYYFDTMTAGLFQFPVMLILLAAPFLLRGLPRRSAEKAFVLLAVAAALILLYVDTVYAGVTMRYSLDFTPILALCAVLLWLEADRYFEVRNAGGPTAAVFTAVVAVSAFISLCVCVMGEDKRLMVNNPDLYYHLYDLFTFWN